MALPQSDMRGLPAGGMRVHVTEREVAFRRVLNDWVRLSVSAEVVERRAVEGKIETLRRANMISYVEMESSNQR